MNIGQEEEAKKLLEDALALEPLDPRLNLRMADILRKDSKNLNDALKHAKIAEEGGLSGALTIEALIKVELNEPKEALEILKGFRTINTQEKRVARTIEAKAYTKLGEI